MPKVSLGLCKTYILQISLFRNINHLKTVLKHTYKIIQLITFQFVIFISIESRDHGDFQVRRGGIIIVNNSHRAEIKY